jgi:hypothetical protein
LGLLILMRNVMTDFLVFIDIRLLYAAYPPR